MAKRKEQGEEQYLVERGFILDLITGGTVADGGPLCRALSGSVSE